MEDDMDRVQKRKRGRTGKAAGANKLGSAGQIVSKAGLSNELRAVGGEVSLQTRWEDLPIRGSRMTLSDQNMAAKGVIGHP